jgi:hypothetical protein
MSLDKAFGDFVLVLRSWLAGRGLCLHVALLPVVYEMAQSGMAVVLSKLVVVSSTGVTEIFLECNAQVPLEAWCEGCCS